MKVGVEREGVKDGEGNAGLCIHSERRWRREMKTREERR